MQNKKRISLYIYKPFLLLCSIISASLGIIGIFLPLLPTTPLLLLAAFCFARSSKRFYTHLLNNRWFGTYIRNYLERKGITMKHKLITLFVLWLTICFTAFFVVSMLWLKLFLFAIAFGVTVHVVTIPTFKINNIHSKTLTSIEIENFTD